MSAFIEEDALRSLCSGGVADAGDAAYTEQVMSRSNIGL